MKHNTVWRKKDNSNEWLKAALRKRYLPSRPAVLDLFCGHGRMYELAYKEKAGEYHGVDNKKIHDPAICTLTNNAIFIAHNDITKYNVFDLDDYGTPWKQLYMICGKHPGPGEITLFVTDGLVMHQKSNQKVTKFVSATEQIPQQMKINGINRFYVDIFATMLLDIERRYGWKTTKARYSHNSRRSVYYWVLKLKKYMKTTER